MNKLYILVIILILPFQCIQGQEEEGWKDKLRMEPDMSKKEALLIGVMDQAELKGDISTWLSAANQITYLWYDWELPPKQFMSNMRVIFAKMPSIDNILKEKDWQNLAWLYYSYASNAYNNADFDAARTNYLKTIQYFRKAKYSEPNIHIYAVRPLMDIYSRWGDYNKAENLFEDAREILVDEHYQIYRLEFFSNWSRGLMDLKRYDEAKDLLEEALNLSPDSSRSSFIYTNLGKVAIAQANYSEAKAYTQSALKNIPSKGANEFQKGIIDISRAGAYFIMGKALNGLSEIDEAEQAFLRALEIYKEKFPGQRKREMTKLLIGMGDFYVQHAKLDNAKAYLDSAMKNIFPFWTGGLPADSLLFTENALFEILELKASIAYTEYEMTNDLTSLEYSLDAYKKVLKVKDLLRARYSYERSKLFQQGESVGTLEKALTVAARLYELNKRPEYLEDAWEFMERNKALVLAENMYQAQLQSELVPEGQQNELDSLLKTKIKLVNERLELKGQAHEEISQEIRKVERAYQESLEKLELTYPEYFNSRYRRHNLSLKKLQPQIQKTQCIASYFWGKERIWAMYIDREDVQLKELEVDGEEIYSFISQLKGRDTRPEALKSYAKSAFTLFDKLLPTSFQDSKNLVVLADGPLYYLPFEPLLRDLPKWDVPISKGMAADSWRELPYAFKKYDFSYAFSGHLYFEQAKEKVNTKALSVMGFAPVYKGELELRYNRDEIEGIEEIVDGSYFYANSSKENFIQKLDQANAFHFAMHAFLDTSKNGESFLHFGEHEGQTSKLYSNEVYPLDLEGKFFVLSACETGVGKLATGEGVMSVARAFRNAGSKNIVMSLWLADGKASKEIWPSFYSMLEKGESSVSALRKVRLGYLEECSPSSVHPFYWAAFVHIGPGVGNKQGFDLMIYIILGVMGLAVSLFLFLRKRKTGT
ncbi:MAG: CHAT domain-containing protein [Bacteroidia bacterium]|nr:CHAT domain-containing protein [Bacteroidia bacterium]